MAVIFTALGAVLIFTIRTNLKAAEEVEQNVNRSSILIKITLNHVQTISILSSLDFKWPNEIIQLFGYLTSTDYVTNYFSFECFQTQVTSAVAGTLNNSIDPYFQKLILYAILPVILLLINSVVWLVIWLCSRNRSQIKYYSMGSFVVLYFFFFSYVTIFLFKTFACISWGSSGEKRLKEQLKVICWESTGYNHLFWVTRISLPFALAWCIGVPLIGLVFILKKRRHFQELNNRLMLGFFVMGYRKKRIYW